VGEILNVSLHSYVQHARCVSCGRNYDLDEVHYTCPECGSLHGTLDLVYDYGRLGEALTPTALGERPAQTLERYHEILPIRSAEALSSVSIDPSPLRILPHGRLDDTPVHTWLKNDTLLPSGSTKDRATALALARAQELGVAAMAAASTGNAASSLAAACAAAGMSCTIFAPADAPAAKLLQIRIHGALLLAVNGTYEEAFDLCAEFCLRSNAYNRSTAINPFLGEGKKTLALEIWEQLGHRAPDAVVVAVGDGCILGGIAKGFQDLRALGWMERLPRLFGVQAAGCAPLAEAWESRSQNCPTPRGETIADSICVRHPRDQVKALRSVAGTDGRFVTVSEDQILAAMSALARRTGIFAEPAAASALAGLQVAVQEGWIDRHEEVVVIVTGHGLKDISAAQKAVLGNPPVSVAPTVASVEEALTARIKRDKDRA